MHAPAGLRRAARFRWAAGEEVHDGALRLDLRQTQSTYRFRLPLEMELSFDDGSTRRETIRMDAPVERFTLVADRPPTAVVDTRVAMPSARACGRCFAFCA